MTFLPGSEILTMQSGRFIFDNGGAEVAVMPVHAGTYTVAAGAATIADTNVTANSIIWITLKTVGGSVAAQLIATITPGIGFTTTGGGSDSSTYNYAIIG